MISAAVASPLVRLCRTSGLAAAGSIRVWANLAPEARHALRSAVGDPTAGPPDEAQLAALYERLGEHFLDSLPGGFAIVLHDPRRGRLFLASDGVGDRSVSYSLTGDWISAAWQDADLQTAPGVSGALDAVRWSEYYANVEITTNRTFFADIRVVLPGEMLIIEPETVRRRARLRKARRGQRFVNTSFQLGFSGSRVMKAALATSISLISFSTSCGKPARLLARDWIDSEVR